MYVSCATYMYSIGKATKCADGTRVIPLFTQLIRTSQKHDRPGFSIDKPFFTISWPWQLVHMHIRAFFHYDTHPSNKKFFQQKDGRITTYVRTSSRMLYVLPPFTHPTLSLTDFKFSHLINKPVASDTDHARQVEIGSSNFPESLPRVIFRWRSPTSPHWPCLSGKPSASFILWY